MYDIGEKFEELEKICDRLKKECHHVGCVDVNECPETHSNCRGRLDLYTALIWELSLEIQRFSENYSHQMQRDIRGRFNVLLHVLSYHQDRYVEVYTLACHTSSLMLNIMNAKKDLENRLQKIF